MMAPKLILLALFISSVLCQGFNNLALKQKVCLFSSASSKVLLPLQLKNANCASNTSYCMNTIYKYGNFQYGGLAALKPVKGEVSMFLSQDEAGRIDYVSFLNANLTTRMNVTLEITGAEPTNILLKDDPEKDGDSWIWDPATNKGKFIWVTQPGYTDGVIIGHITFVDNYCIKSTFTQPNNAIQKISILSGSSNNMTRILTVPYTSGSAFEFCQYPQTATVYTNATCPTSTDGKASISIVFGPTNNKYSWYKDDGTLVNANSASVSNLAPGIYHVLVNDTSSGNGCTAERTVTISAPYMYAPFVTTTAYACSVKGSASATPNGGSGGFTYQWKQGTTVIGTGSSISGLEMGSYSVCISDSCGSQSCSSFVIETSGCCGDGICQANEQCGTSSFCQTDCGVCCLPGTYKNGQSCVVCPAGSRGTTYQADSCTPCPENTYNAGASDMCAACPENTYSQAGSGKCDQCPAGTVRPSAETACRACPAGQFADLCGNGCTDAPAGTVAVGGGWHPVTCEPGYYSAGGVSSCTICPAGTYSAAGASSCTTCPTGTTTANAGATHVLHCE